jgi:hypothetical protein
VLVKLVLLPVVRPLRVEVSAPLAMEEAMEEGLLVRAMVLLLPPSPLLVRAAPLFVQPDTTPGF